MKAELEITDGSLAGSRAQLPVLGSFAIGRGSSCDLRVSDKAVSRAHCQIDSDGEFFWLVDCDSHNGTGVNGHRVSRCVLYDGDTIKVGQTHLRFRLLEESRA
jgi:pSer/pThr/pTyr-binding forkhead associated (FHA) protein